jgi:hypothetical protein
MIDSFPVPGGRKFTRRDVFHTQRGLDWSETNLSFTFFTNSLSSTVDASVYNENSFVLFACLYHCVVA